MSNMVEKVTLEFGGETLEIVGYPGQGRDTSDATPLVDNSPWYVLTSDRIVGWWDTPMIKTDVTEKGAGDGAFPVPEKAVFYATRTVTLNLGLIGTSRSDIQQLMNGLLRMVHHIVRMTVYDDSDATYVNGFCTIDFGTYISDEAQTARVTLTCTDPYRYGLDRTYALVPSGDGSGGLVYDEEHGYLLLPIQFAGDAITGNSTTLYNHGTSTSYPTITIDGSFPFGCSLFHADGILSYNMPIGQGAPVTLDSLTRTASVNGIDVTRALTKRDFPSIAPGGSTILSAFANGNGTVIATVRDTYL